MTETNDTAPADTLAPPPAEVTSYAAAGAERRAEIERAMAELDLADGNSVLFFGSKAQQTVTGVADEMLEGVRNKDSGPAGAALNEMVATLRGFSLEELVPDGKPGLLSRLLGRGRPIAKVLQRYESIRSQIDAIGDRLDAHSSTLMRDIALLDRLYAHTLDYFRALAVYIAAGEEHLRRLDADRLPALERDAASGTDMLAAQALRDMRERRDALARRVHDLKLTRQITLQSLPSIRLVQENDKALVAKIGSTLANTLPLWRQQLAMAVTLARAAESGDTLKQATDLTNDLLTANAGTLRESTKAVRREVERGIVSIDTLKQANETLIATLDDTLRIVEEGRQQRAAAERQLAGCEAELRQALLAAQARERPPPASSA
ncbi:MAG TPA: toxic anion resistance protein [Gammaproteobacteria bacterium]|nr:toxic anion resistance protein [Gammaproteobacteria bacterium]